MSEQNYWTRTAGRRLSRRGVLRGSAVAGLGLAGAALIGCGDDDDDDEAPAAQAPASGGAAAPGGVTAAADQQAKYGGLFTNTRTRSPTGHFDPHTALNEQLAFWWFIGNQGTFMTQDGSEVLPELLESWEITGDGTEMIVKVRSNAKWHDRGVEAGRALDAEDAVYNLMRLSGKLDSENAGLYQWRSMFQGMERAEAVDEKTVKVTFAHPTSTFLAGMAYSRVIWASRDFLDAGGDFTDAESMVGTGPFVMDEFTEDQRIVFKKNPQYWDEGLPYVDTVRTEIIPDTNSAVTAFAQGDLDHVSGQNKVIRETVLKLVPEAVERKWLGPCCWLQWRFNAQRKPFDDPRVRRALFLVPDYHRMNNEFWGEGYWSPAAALSSAYPDMYQADEVVKLPGYNPDTKEQDRKDAVALLAAAGFPDGEIDFGIMHYGSSYFQSNAIFIQSDLQKVWPKMGANLDLAPDTPSFGKRQTSNDYDTLSYTQFFAADSVLEGFAQYHSRNEAGGTEGGRNYGRFSDQGVDDLLQQAIRTLDLDERKIVLREFQDLVLELHAHRRPGHELDLRSLPPRDRRHRQLGQPPRAPQLGARDLAERRLSGRPRRTEPRRPPPRRPVARREAPHPEGCGASRVRPCVRGDSLCVRAQRYDCR